MTKSSRHQPNSQTHKCYAPPCIAKIEHRFLMCPNHWRRLPKKLKQAITDSYNGSPRTRQSPAYIAAVREAMAYFEHGPRVGPDPSEGQQRLFPEATPPTNPHQ